MNRFGELLKEARKRAKHTQQALAEKVDVDDSYISKIETGAVDRPPAREVVLKLADALGLEEKTAGWRAFLLAAGVLSEEDIKGVALVEVEDGEVEEEAEHASGAATDSAGQPAIAIRSLPSSTTGGKLDRLIASGRFSEEEEKEVEEALIEIIKRLISFKEIQRKMRKEG